MAPMPPAAPIATRPWLRTLLAAAAALLLIGGASWWSTRADPVVPAVAQGRLALLLDDRFEASPVAAAQHKLAAGATFWVPRGEPAELLLESGATLSIDGESLARLVAVDRGVDVELDYGSLRAINNSAASLRLRAAGVEIALEPSAQLQLRCEFDKTRPAPTGAAAFSAQQAHFRAFPLGWLSARVLAGEAKLTVGDIRRTLDPNAPAFVALGETNEFVASDELTGLLALFEDLAGEGPYSEQGLAKFQKLVEQRPALWLALAAPLADTLRSQNSTMRWRRELRNWLALDTTDTSLRIARELWLERPEEFTDDQKIAFAERGAHEFQVEALATIQLYDTQDRQTDPLPASLYLALRGNGIGERELDKALLFFAETAKGPSERLAPALLAAVAKKRLGKPEAWDRARSWVRDAVESALAREDFETAVMLVIALESAFEFDRNLAEGVRPISLLQQRTMARIAERSPDFKGQQDVRALLAQLLAN
jgi:hypothetical protein